MHIIDLRNKQSANVQNAQAISRIFDSLGRAEASRQNRQRTTNVLQAMAAGGTPQDIARAATTSPQFDTGFQGFIQQLGARFAPNVVSPIERQIAQQGLSRAFEDPLIREGRQASLESTKALTEQRRRRGIAGSGLEKQWEFKLKQRNLLTDRLDRARAFQNEAEEEKIKLKIQKLDGEMDGIARQLQGQSKQQSLVTGEDFDKIDLAEIARFRNRENKDTEIAISKYVEKLDNDSLEELEKIISGGDPQELNAALKTLKDKYGIIR